MFEQSAKRLDGDFREFLKYIEENNSSLSDSTLRLGKNDCFAINQKLSVIHEAYVKPGRTQENYAEIDFFHFFVIRMELYRISKVPKIGLVLKKTEHLDTFMSWTPVERYILMLSVQLVYYTDRDLSLQFMFSGLSKSSTFDSKETNALESYYPDELRYNVEKRLLLLFGLIEPAEGITENTRGYQMEFYNKTGDGRCVDSVLEKIMKQRFYQNNEDKLDTYLKAFSEKDKTVDGKKIKAFLYQKAEAGQESLICRVKVGDCIRKIKIGNQDTLESLHDCIQKAVGFDDDHLYCFTFWAGRLKRSYFRAECEEKEYFADETCFAMIPYYQGMQFSYMFDFGDKWKFDIKIEKILQEYTETPVITQSIGKAPDQYRYW